MELFEEFDKVSHQDWMDKITVDLKGKDFQETLVWNSPEGIAIQPFYTKSSNTVSSVPHKKSDHWIIRETVVISSIEQANKKALLALKGGANAVLFVGEIKDQPEMDLLLKDIQTEIIEIHFYTSSPKHTSTLITFNQGSISYDYLGKYLFTGSWNKSKKDDIKELSDITVSTIDIKTITVESTNYSNAGHTLTQEIAFGLAQAVEYLHLLTDIGLDPNTIASKIQFSFGIGTNYFFEIAKIRAARKLWQLILKQYKVTDTPMSIHSETSIDNSSNEDLNYNILRNTTKAMSAIIGGCDSLTVLPHDNNEATSNFCNRIARNVQHILKEEAFFGKVNNPADGAYYVEYLTGEFCNKAWKLFQEVEFQGGFLACVDNNFIQNELKKSVNA